LWREWARVELAKETPYRTPTVHRDYGGIAVSLAREEYPSTKRFRDPEIFYRVNKPWHLGLIVRSESYERVLQLLAEYDQAFRKEFTAIAPPEEKPGHYV
jgi:hypothetical protein